MTKDEIKRSLPMPDFLAQNGLRPNRAGFIRCPFHKGDNTPSMKVYKASVYCFGCGWTGDVFKVYQELYHCDFKTAFLALGGEYEHEDKAKQFAKAMAYHDAKAKQEREQLKQLEAARRYREATKYYWDCKDNLAFTEAIDGTDSEEFWSAVDAIGWAEIGLSLTDEERERRDEGTE